MKQVIVALVAALSFSGCAGYQLGDAAKPRFLRDIKTIAVQNFRNGTFNPRVETLVTNTIIKQLQQDGTYQITTADKADAVLEGVVKAVNRNPTRGLRGNVLATTEFNLTVIVGYTLRGRDGKPVLGPADAAGGTSFFVGSDVTTDERQALPIATEDLAVHLVSQMTEGW